MKKYLPNLLKQANKELDAALYVFWQPYKLYDKNTLLKYIGNINLLDSISVYAIEMINHKNRVSLIINENLESKTGLFLNKINYFLEG